MGCHYSKDNDVVGSTAGAGSKARNGASKHRGSNCGRRSDRTTFRDDVTSDLIQHLYVDDINEYFEFHSTIGTGHFGCVKHATSKKSGKEWAVKIVNLNNEVDKDALRNEINILKRLHHPQIVRVIASYEDKEHMYMVMQLCKGKELYEHLYKENRTFSEDDVRKLIRGLLRAIAFLHSNFITHRDLKLENILLENAENPSSLKLCDFGLSTRFKRGEKLQKSLGTIDYVAPEVLDGDYNEKCDLWSVGVICYELLTGVSPFHAPTIDETMGKIFDGILIFEDAIWKHFSPSAITFVKSLVKENVDARFSAEQALSHKWLVDSEKSEQGNARLQTNKRLLLTNMLSFSRCRKMKQTALLSVALGISEDHIQQEMAAEVFHSMDHSKKGTLTRDEFCNSMVECGVSRPDADDLFTRINQSKTGQINFLEFIAAVMDQRDIGQNTIKEAFGLLDGEKKGRLSIVGLQDVFKNSMVPEEVQEMIASADKKGDGFVDFESFQDMFTQPNSPLAKVDEVSESHEGFSSDSFVSNDDLEKRGTLTASSFTPSVTALEPEQPTASRDAPSTSPQSIHLELDDESGKVKTPEANSSVPDAVVVIESPVKPSAAVVHAESEAMPVASSESAMAATSH